MKGGVGKTTLCKEIGFHLAKKRNFKVLFIDIDPQINLTQSLFKRYGFLQKKQFYVDNEENPNGLDRQKRSEASIEYILTYSSVNPPEIEKGIQKLDENIHIIPGSLGLEFSLRNLNSSTLETGIYEFIKRNNLREKYHFILIDCPPTYSSYTVSALLPSDYLVIPVKPEGYSILGIDMLMQVIDLVKSERSIYFESKPLHNLGVIFTDIKRSPTPGIEKALQKIKNSEELQKRELNFFEEYFLHNAQIPKDIDYFIDESNSESSKSNLDVLVDELIERMEFYGEE